jgi:FkbM family methyltransferase
LSYSQNQEEQFILTACSQAAGQFLDVGAWNARDKSNTRALFEKGWRGVLIEPSPLPFAGLQAEYGTVPGMTLISAAVVLDESLAEVEMYITADALSTTEEANYEKWKGQAQFDGKSQVPAITLERIFERYGDFDFVSLDTEGTSVALLYRLLALGKRPKCICVEHDDCIGDVQQVVARHGYTCVHCNSENLVLVRG